MRVNAKDVASGALFIAIGLLFGLNAWFSLPMGRALAMGPGYFPALLSLVLILFGAVIAVGGIKKPREAIGLVPWRGLALILGALVFFAVTVRGLGLAVSLLVATLSAALAIRQPIIPAVLFAAALTVFCVATFVYALGLPYPVIGPWLGGLR